MGSFLVALCAAGAAEVRASTGLSNSALIDMYVALALFMGVSIDVSLISPTPAGVGLP
jgi:hypothetical protein